MSAADRTESIFRRLLADDAGHFAITAAVMLPIALAGGGVAIDVTNLMFSRSQLQRATDAAALAAATALKMGTTDTDGAQKLPAAFVSGQMANYLAKGRIDPGVIKSGTTVNGKATTNSNGGKDFSVAVNASYPVAVNGPTRLLGWNTVTLGVSSTSTSGNGSSAVKNLTALSMYLVLDRSGSMDEDTATVNASQPTAQTCSRGTCTTSPNDYTKMEALKIAVGKLTAELNRVDPNMQYVRKGAISYINNAQAPTNLARGSSGVTSCVNALTATGATNSGGAFRTAYNALTNASEDAAQRAKNGEAPTKYIVFMTDGENNVMGADTLTKQNCDLARTKNMKVYTIAAMAPRHGQDLLKYCATSTPTYVDVESAVDFINAFQMFAATATQSATLLAK
jgi:Flp pilus assembly protein TadG